MKNIILTLLLAVVSISCTEVLVEKPKSIATETFYNTDAEAIAATNAAYAPIVSNDFNSYFTLLESMADNVIGKGSLAAIEDYNGYSTANISNMEGVWIQLYLGVRNANIVIKNVPNGNITSEPLKKSLVAEARYVRAFCYFALLRLWGSVPLRTDENLELQDVSKSPTEAIYKVILADLAFAEQNLPDAPRILGTASKWVAKTLLSDVHLTLGDWKNAKDKAKEVIDSKKFTLVPVKQREDFENIYGADLVTSTEEIFYFKYNDLVGWSMMNFFHIDKSGYKPYGANYFSFYLTDDHIFYKNWKVADIRKDLLYKWDIGLGNNTYLFRKYIDPKGTTNGSNDFPIYRYPEVLLIFAEASNRLAGGPDAEALEYVNQVHRRAYGYAPTTPSPVDFQLKDYNEASFFELVLQEKAYETFLECKRWFDLKRTGKVEQMIKATTGKTINPSMYLWPIPASELQYNRALDPVKDQNPGY